jgi:phosphodiesterase/alkaline phosphatase D-like protein
MAFAQTKNQVQITKGPVVEHSDAKSAVIAWSTNVPASAVVKYGTDQNNLAQTAQAPWGGLTHRVTIKNLDPGKTYHYQIQSGQGEGTGSAALGPVGTFSTKTASAQH